MDLLCLSDPFCKRDHLIASMAFPLQQVKNEERLKNPNWPRAKRQSCAHLEPCSVRGMIQRGPQPPVNGSFSHVFPAWSDFFQPSHIA